LAEYELLNTIDVLLLHMRWLRLWFDLDLTAVRRAIDCLSKVIKVTVT